MKTNATNSSALHIKTKASDVPNWQNKKTGYVQDVGQDCTNTVRVNLINKRE